MFNKSMVAIVMLTATAAHAQPEVDMTGDASADPKPAPESKPEPAAVDVPGVAPDGGPWQKGTYGISLPFTLLSNITSAVSLTAERVPQINLLYFLNEKRALDIVTGVLVHKSRYYDNSMPPVAKDQTNFGFAIGLGYRMYKHTNKFHTFLEPQAVMAWANVAETATLELSGLAMVGAEAMFTEWASLAGSVGGGVTANGTFDDIKVATAANLAVNLYWK
jgi:hypothetical protein